MERLREARPCILVADHVGAVARHQYGFGHRKRLLQGGCPGVAHQIVADGIRVEAVGSDVDDVAKRVHEVGILVHEYHVSAQALIFRHDNIADLSVVGLHELVVIGINLEGNDARNKQVSSGSVGYDLADQLV